MKNPEEILTENPKLTYNGMNGDPNDPDYQVTREQLQNARKEIGFCVETMKRWLQCQPKPKKYIPSGTLKRLISGEDENYRPYKKRVGNGVVILAALMLGLKTKNIDKEMKQVGIRITPIPPDEVKRLEAINRKPDDAEDQVCFDI